MQHATHPPRVSWVSLFTNHADAWGLTCVIASLGLIIHNNLNWQHAPLLVAVTLNYWLGFALNDYFDAQFDASDPVKARRNFFCQVHIPRKLLLGFVLILEAAVFLVFASYGLFGISMYVTAIVVMWAYSAAPIRLKNRPGLDLLTHAIFVQTFPYVVSVALPSTGWRVIDSALVVLFALASLAAQLEQQVRDYHLDKQFESNFTIWFGHQPTRILLQLVTILLVVHVVAIISLQMLPLFLLPYIVIAAPIMLHRFVRGKKPRSENLVRLTLALSLVYTALLWLWAMTGNIEGMTTLLLI
ncbi:UbiA family prenyltransferase [Phototrophicus methaneseepsis]|uniref:UbiA family prenyltransferase n=1 Tax=Phototrophicus methaneseepsis TaxID=2710758 RepID=A0A7S8IEH2_9CHLR|nr:UbiA family prenyltransferase [Phototrophicus methaneseepsis]QPC82439.1 UbiA family prenyltransferase [Phototrophicus methaneseepsis]